MNENEKVNVQELFNVLNSTETETQKSPDTGSLGKFAFGTQAVSQLATRDFGGDEPFTAKDMMDYFNSIGLRTNEICSVLTINSNRLGYMTKVSATGQEMPFEYIPPTLEIFLRLVKAYPEYAPWKKITVQDVADATGFDVVTLANICGSSESSGERWEQESNNTNPLVSVLLKLIYTMAKSGVDQVVFREVSELVKTSRNNNEASRLVNDNSWNSIHSQTSRKVRKIMRNCLNDLELNGSKAKLQNPQSGAMIKEMIIRTPDNDAQTINDYRSKSGLTGAALEKQISILSLCLEWHRVRNSYQKAIVSYSRQKKESAQMPPARLEEYRRKLGDELITDEVLRYHRENLSKVTKALESEASTSLPLWS
ncbi:hypothetical protein [Vibrio cholerae]|uniref:hypothetical protein n=1 Tax=Vibrio cholerae TaxID=666 RepID=UPI0004E3C762|nr:hypothetical protein [Vibrio cholerae]EGR2118993.1 hypothetical protein [Vibrio cholerae]EGR4074901.1 hypothetical protein [Vibrio cholerae]KFE28760.1 hypothetical protein DN30_580 [Vibrio cholerae]MBY4641940.1 hypothetical protein [Vibrio cholerae]MCR9658212.1 hypothetical protein [Vibrio cholerae]